MAINDKVDKFLYDCAGKSIKLSIAIMIASWAFNVGALMSRNAWKPTESEIQDYRNQGIQMQQQVYETQGSNEMLNPRYSFK